MDRRRRVCNLLPAVDRIVMFGGTATSHRACCLGSLRMPVGRLSRSGLPPIPRITTGL